MVVGNKGEEFEQLSCSASINNKIFKLNNYMYSSLSWSFRLGRISLPSHDLLGEERWPISQRRRAKSLLLNGLLLGSFCTGIQVKLINHCQAVRVKQ